MRAARVVVSLFVLAVTASVVLAEQAQVQIVAPETGATAQVGDSVQVLVVTKPDLDVTTVAVMVDSLGVGMTQTTPYVVTWDTAGAAPGDHVLRAFAYLKSGEKVGAEPVTVTLRAAPSQPASEPAAQASAAPEPVTLKEGTPVLLTTTEKLVSGRVPEGSTVRYRVARDIVVQGGNVLIAYGSFAQGKVTRSRRRGMFGKAGQLEFTVETAQGVDGTPVPLRAQQAAEGHGNKGTVIVSTLLLTVFAVFIHGRDVDVPQDTEITAYVDHDTVIRQPQAATPGGVIRGEPLEAVSITNPGEGTNVRIGSPISVEVQVTPSNKSRSLRVFMDDKEVASKDSPLGPVSIPTRGLATGQHPIAVEVTFTNGRTVRSASVAVLLVH